jgi:hypothetical protein
VDCENAKGMKTLNCWKVSGGGKPKGHFQGEQLAAGAARGTPWVKEPAKTKKEHWDQALLWVAAGLAEALWAG